MARKKQGKYTKKAMDTGSAGEIVRFRGTHIPGRFPFTERPKWIEQAIDDGKIVMDESTGKVYLNIIDVGRINRVEIKLDDYLTYVPTKDIIYVI